MASASSIAQESGSDHSAAIRLRNALHQRCGTFEISLVIKLDYLCHEFCQQNLSHDEMRDKLHEYGIAGSSGTRGSPQDSNAIDQLLDEIQLQSSAIVSEMPAPPASFQLPAQIYFTIRSGSLTDCKDLLQSVRKETTRDAAISDEVFQHIVNALIKLRLRHVPVSADIELYLQTLLCRHAHIRLASGIAINTNDIPDWWHHLDMVCDTWGHICAHYDRTTYDGVDSRLLQWLRIIHNNLHFLQGKPWIRNHFPIVELMKCLALFIAIFRYGKQYEKYRLLLNKRNVLGALEVICRGVTIIRAKLLDAEQRLRCIYEDVQRAYFKDSPQMHDEDDARGKLHTVVTHVADGTCKSETVVDQLMQGLLKKKTFSKVFDSLINCESNALFDFQPLVANRSDRRIFKGLIKCFTTVQALHSIENILRHLDMAYNVSRMPDPPKLLQAYCIKRMLQTLGEYVKNTKHTPNMPHSVLNMVEKLLSETFLDKAKGVREFFSHEVSISKFQLNLAQESQFLERVDCERLRALCQVLYLQASYQCVQKFCSTLLQAKALTSMATAMDYLGAVADIEPSLIAMSDTVHQYFDGKLASWHARETTDKATFAYFTKVRLLLRMFLTFTTVGDFASLQQIRESMSVRPLEDTKKLLITKVRNIRHINMYVFGSCFHVSKEVLEDPVVSIVQLHDLVTAMEGIDELEMEKTCKQLNVPNSSALSHGLKKYYEDVFCSEKKYSVLAGFATEVVQEMKRQDHGVLQAYFDERRDVLQGFFQLYHCDTIDGLIANYESIPPAAMAAMELCQLELCIILKSIGRFGENTCYLKCGIPIVNGKNYRNYLAHGALCYSILTDTTESLVVLANGLVLATTPTQLFERPRKASTKFRFPSGKEMLAWISNADVVAPPISSTPAVGRLTKLQSLNQPLLNSILHVYNALRATEFADVSPIMAEPSLNALLLAMLQSSSGSCCTSFERWMLASCKVLLNLQANTFYNRIQNCIFNNTLIAFRSDSALLGAIQASGISLDVPTSLNSNGYSSTPFLVLLHNRSLRILQRLPTARPESYRNRQQCVHPLSCAIGQRNRSGCQKLAYLKRCGFTYLDNSGTLKSAIASERDDVVQEILLSLRERTNALATVTCGNVHVREIVKLLDAWRVFGYLEEPSIEQLLALHLATFQNNEAQVQQLLTTSRTARTVHGLGVAHEIAFDCSGGRSFFSSNRPEDFSAMLQLCDRMIQTMEERHLQGEAASWQQFAVRCAGSTIHLRTPEGYPEDDLHLQPIESKLNSLPKVMDKLLSTCQGYLVAHVLVESKSDDVRFYFFKSDEMACAFSVLPHGHTVNLESLVNYRDEYGQSSLWCSFNRWNPNICDLLLKYGADPVARKDAHWTPLHNAIVNNANIAKLLLRHCVRNAPAALEQPSPQGTLPIHYAAFAEDDSILVFLLDSGVNVRAKDKHGWTAAMHCIYRSKLSKLKLLLERDPTLLEVKSNAGHTLLHISALSSVSTLDVLLPLQPRFEHRSPAGDTPIAIALRYENRQWLKRVLEHFESTGKYSVTVRELEDVRALAIRMQDMELLQVANVHLSRLSSELKLFLDSQWNELTRSRTPEHREFDLCLRLVYRWRVFAKLEAKRNYNGSPLCQAVELQDVELTENVLRLAKEVRTIAQHGMMNEVAFYHEDKASVYGQQMHSGLADMLTDCNAMFEHLDNATLSSMDWKESKVRCANKGTIRIFTQSGDCYDRPLGSLKLQSTALTTWVTKLHEACEGHPFACATIESSDNEIKYCFLKVDRYACAFDIVPPAGVSIDLKHFVNSATAGNSSPLWCCVQSWNPQICHLLLENGADPTRIDAETEHRAPLHWAVAHNPDVARTLLDHCSEDTTAAETPSTVGKRLIHYAACAGEDDILRHLIDRGVDLKAQDSKGRTAAMFCVAKNHPTRLAILLDKDPELLEMCDNRRFTLLHYSAFHSGRTLRELLPLRPNFSRGSAKCSALELAIHDKHIRWIKDAVAYWNSESHTEEHSEDAGMWAPSGRELRAIRAFADEALDDELSTNVDEYVARISEELSVFLDSLEHRLATVGRDSTDPELSFCIRALERWSVMGMLHQKWRHNQTPLRLAVELGNAGLVEKLLHIEERCRIVEHGWVTSEIVVEHGGEVSQCDHRSVDCHPEQMTAAIGAIERILQTTDFSAELRKSMLQLHDTVVNIYVPVGVATDVRKPKGEHAFKTPTECLKSLLQICKRLPMAYATVMPQPHAPDAKHYFIKTASHACVFDVFHRQVDNLRDGRRTELLWSCLGSWNWDVCKLLLANGADPTMISESRKWAPIHWAIAHRAEIARKLLEYGTENGTGESIVEVSDAYGDRPIHVAALHDTDTSLVKHLINRGANVKAQNDNGLTAASLCVVKNSPLKLKLLLERDPDLVHTVDAQGYMLHHVSAKFSVECLPVLLPLQPDFARKTIAGHTAISIALQEENVQWVKLMLAQLSTVDTFLRYGELETMAKLADSRADEELRNAVSVLWVKMHDRLDKLAGRMRLVYPELRELHDANLSWLIRTLGNAILAIGKALALKHCEVATCSGLLKMDHSEMKNKWLQLDEEFRDRAITSNPIEALVSYCPDSATWLERESASSLYELFTNFETMLQVVKSSKLLQTWSRCSLKPTGVRVTIFTQNPLSPETVDSNAELLESLESSVKYLFTICDREQLSYAIVKADSEESQRCFLKAGANSCIFSTPAFSFAANKRFEYNVHSLWDINVQCCNSL